mmetsp:Transcript_164632/g.528149  ORF Transcript_164632/g.528149 Transcript_164632/m.528149 type:complete len:1033 (+) Transcript_164632:223-3321(+)
MASQASQKSQANGGKDDGGMDTRKVSKDEAAFILGQGGKTKAKLCAVSGAGIDLQELKGPGGVATNQLHIKGTPHQRQSARKYIEFVIAQRSGPVKIANPSEHDDLTLLTVPADTVSFITGSKGYFLRLVEEEWSALLFFLLVDPKRPPAHVDPGNTNTLAIFGTERSRRGAELKVMAAIEMKQPGHFTRTMAATESADEGFSTDTVHIMEDDYSYALGRGGTTRKKLARASNCIVEYVGRIAFFCGCKRERSNAKEYMKWLLMQRVGETVRVDHKGRDDVTMVMVPGHCIGYVAGHRGCNLRAIEEETSTFCFIEGFAEDYEDHKPLLIFGRKEDRSFAETLVWERISHKFDEAPDYGHGGKGKRSNKGKGKGKDRGKDGYGKDYGGKGWDNNWHRDQDDGKDIREKPKDALSASIDISEDDAAFLMGPGGRVKRKIAGVSGAFLELKANRMEIYGTADQIARASKYVGLVMAQRVGPVTIEDATAHDDLSIIEVPAEAVSFVTGKQGCFLRLVEEEFSTLLFFLDFNKSSKRDQLERLAIFGALRDRRGAELKVMSAIEMKQPFFFTRRDSALPMQDPQEGFSTDRLVIEEDDYSYALGKGGATRKKIARASGCVIEYIGRYAYLSGVKTERIRAREYLIWLFRQRVGPVEVDYANREDVTVLAVPKDCVGFVTGHKGTSLRLVEDDTGTFCFIEGGRDDPHRDPKPLLIFGTAEARREAEEQLKQRIDLKLVEGWVHEEGGGGGGHGHYGGYGAWNEGKGQKGGGKWHDSYSKGKGRGQGKDGGKGKFKDRDHGHAHSGHSGPAAPAPPSFGGLDWPAPNMTRSPAAAPPMPAPAMSAPAAAPAMPPPAAAPQVSAAGQAQATAPAGEQHPHAPAYEAGAPVAGHYHDAEAHGQEGAWGDWGGSSDEEEEGGHAAGGGHVAGAGGGGGGAGGGQSGTNQGGGSQAAAAGWNRHPFGPYSAAAALAASTALSSPARGGPSTQGMPSPAKFYEDVPLPAFLLHEEAWPDLGMRGGAGAGQASGAAAKKKGK